MNSIPKVELHSSLTIQNSCFSFSRSGERSLFSSIFDQTKRSSLRIKLLAALHQTTTATASSSLKDYFGLWALQLERWHQMIIIKKVHTQLVNNTLLGVILMKNLQDLNFLLYQINIPVRLPYFGEKTLIKVLWLFLTSENSFHWLAWSLAFCTK